jgi:metal-sulfur cluster biosynthetic enzyme
MSEPTINLTIKEAEVREALRQVIDPELGLNVIELGLLRKVELAEDTAHLVVIMTTPFCPYGPQLIEQMRKTVQEFLQLPTTIELGSDLWDPSMMEEGAGGDWGLF